ncbi:MAG: hypothetical protein QNJ81_03145 [Acidimicrobiia bacterium]|nr:hypothetical protein [Acidimicrobiia bacterium]
MRNLRYIALLFVLVLTAAACGGSAEDALLEQILESGNDGISDIDIDSDTGELNISFEGEDGEEVNVVSQGEDGEFSMTIEGEDGETFTFGGGEVPADMVTPIADGGTVVQSYSSDSDRSVSVEYSAAMFEQLVDLYEGVFAGVDDVSRTESSYTTEDGTIRNVGWYGGSGAINVTVSDCYTISSGQLDSVCVTIYELDS